MNRLTKIEPVICWITCLVSLLVWNPRSRAQVSGPGPGPMNPAGATEPFSVAAVPGIPGSIWISATGADKGLGYGDSYYSIGGKRRLFEGPLSARWLAEVHGHVTHEEGKPFANFGLERVTTFAPTGANIGFNVWFDIDDDREEFFDHTFTQVGVGTSIKTQLFDFRANGYIPVGDDDFSLTSRCFVEHSIVAVAGVDRALEGFDTEIRVRPHRWSYHHGFIDVGGYAYKSNMVNAFGGFRTRFGIEPIPGIQLSAELNRDTEFDTTGFLRLTIALGGQDRAHGDYSLIARDLERTVRNDHIVRQRRRMTPLIDPDTGLPYRVHHVDNTAVAEGDGSVEAPHDTLLDAELASAPDDIIFVREGDGSANGMNAGITLQDGQLFLGDGIEHLIPTVGDGTYMLCSDVDGNTPTITNQPNLAVVTLANRNTVAGFNVDGFNAANHGLFGSGTVDTIIRDNMIMNLTGSAVLLNGSSGTLTITDNIIATTGVSSDAIAVVGMVGAGNTLDIIGNDIVDPGENGISITASAGENTVTVSLNNIVTAINPTFPGSGIFIDTISNDILKTDDETIEDGGVWTISENTVEDAVLNGILVSDFLDGEAEFEVAENIVIGSGRDGIRFEMFDGSQHLFSENRTDNNADDGLELVNYLGADADIDIQLHTSTANTDDGIAVATGNGDLTIFNSTSSSNMGNGVDVNNFTNDVTGTSTVISNSVIANNGAGIAAGINYFLDVPSSPPDNLGETFTVTSNSISGNGVNVIVEATGTDTRLTTNIIGNTALTSFASDGIDLRTMRGATQEIQIVNNSNISGTALSTGVALRILVDDDMTGLLTTMTGSIRANTISNLGGEGTDVGTAGVHISVQDESNLSLTFEDNVLNQGDGIGLSAELNVSNTMVNRLDLVGSTFNGATGTDDSVVIRSSSVSRLDMSVQDNTFTNAEQNSFDLGLLGSTMTRVILEDNQFIDSSGNSDSEDAILLTTVNTARLTATIQTNTIQDYGGAGQLIDDTGVPNTFWSPGVEISAAGASNMAIRIDDNTISGSALEAITIESLGSANADTLVTNNSFNNNDRALSDDGILLPTKLSGQQDFRVDKSSASDLCLALHNNVGTTGIGFLVESGGAPSLEFEEGVNSQSATIVGNVNTTVFNPSTSACIMAIEAEETVFTSAGFP